MPRTTRTAGTILAALGLLSIVGCGGPPESDPTVRLHAVLPSFAIVGEPVLLRVTAFNLDGLPTEWSERLFFATTDSSAQVPTEFKVTAAGTRYARIAFGSTGIFRATVRDTLGHVAVAGPIAVVSSDEELRNRPGEPALHLYWGDAHGHSDVGDGIHPPKQYFFYARDLAHLDFTCLSEHDFQQFLGVGYDVDPSSWDAIAAEANSWRTPSFAVLLGWEWSSRVHGHRVVLFPNDDSRYVSFQTAETPKQLAAALEGTGAFSILAHPNGSQLTPPIDWDTVVPGFDRAVEVYSGHGAMDGDDDFRPTTAPEARSSAMDALRWGFRLGLVAFSDTHLSTPGNPSPPVIRDAPYRGGLTAVYATDASQAAIFAALRDGQCYATSGERFLVRFRAADRSMGETLLTARGAPVAIEARAGAPGPWKRLDLMRNDRVERTFDGDGRAEIEISATVGPFDGDTALWLRGESEAGERFWTTPVWVSVP
jgi:hypothetical protein